MLKYSIYKFIISFMDNSLQTPTEQKPVEIETPQATEQQVKKKKPALLYINILLLLIVLALGAYILKTENFFTEKKEEIVEREETEEEDKEEKEKEEEVAEPTTSEFVGKYIRATLPLGWSIKEEDLGSQFKGFQVTHGSKTIMEIEILDGVGSIGCPQIVLFSDSPSNYEEEKKEMNVEIGMEATVLDYTNTKYSAIRFFGVKMRRVGNRMFFDSDKTTQTFEAQCEGSWVVIEELSKIASTNHFNLTISSQATEEELNSLDTILENMRLR